MFGGCLLFHRFQLAIIELVAMRAVHLDLMVQGVGLTSFRDDLQLLLETLDLDGQRLGLVLDHFDRRLGAGQLLGGRLSSSSVFRQSALGVG